MKTHNYRNGLTLIELMVTIVAASILILTVSLILVMAFRSWRINNAFVDLRRDSAFAFSMMTRDVRESFYDGLDDNTAGSLEVISAVPGEPTVTYRQTGNTLTREGILVIPQNVQSFDSAKNNTGDGVLLTLELANEAYNGYIITITNEVFVNTRN